MNRISNLLPRSRFLRPVSPKRDLHLQSRRMDVEAMLREAAYILHLTRSVKESIAAQRREEIV
jgi:hypothetical protein